MSIAMRSEARRRSVEAAEQAGRLRWPAAQRSVQSVRTIQSARGARSSEIKLTIVVPVLNEENTVLGVIADLLDVDYGCDMEIIVVDDGSTDDTSRLLAGVHDPRVRVHHHLTNFGKGAALRSGSRLATGTHLVPFDADGEYDARDLPRLVAPIVAGRASVVYGTRIFGNNTVYQSYRYAMGNRMLTLVANLLFDAYLSDMHTCLKVVPVSLFHELRLRQVDFGLDTELTAALLRKGIRPFEVPVSYHSRSHAEGKKITWRDGVSCLRVLFGVRVRRHSGLPTQSLTKMRKTIPSQLSADASAGSDVRSSAQSNPVGAHAV
jgi:dolichol-phosphate hexosyltransferase